MGEPDPPAWARRLKASMTMIMTKVENLDTKVENLNTKVENLNTKVENLNTKIEEVRTDLSNQIHTHACRCPGSAMHIAVQALTNLHIVHESESDGAVSDISDAATANWNLSTD